MDSGGLTVVGGATVSSGGLNVSAGGVEIAAGGLNVRDGGATIYGGTTIANLDITGAASYSSTLTMTGNETHNTQTLNIKFELLQ